MEEQAALQWHPPRWDRDPHLWAEREFEPTAKQRELYLTLDRTPEKGLALVGYGGAMGGGKTRALVELAIDTALHHMGTRILVARHRYETLRTTTMEEFFHCCPPGWIVAQRRSQPQSVSLRCRDWPPGVTSTIYFRHLTEWAGLGSQEYGAVFIDEAGEVSVNAARMLLTRLRHPNQLYYFFVAASNPHPGWFEQWFIKRELPERELEACGGRVLFIQSKMPDNPHLAANYEAQQRAIHPPEWVDRFIEGRFDAAFGAVYGRFDPLLHCWTAPLPKFRRMVGGLDFGGTSPWSHFTAAVVAGLTEDGHLIRVAEFEERGPGVVERLERWIEEQGERHGKIAWRADRTQSGWIDAMRRLRVQVEPSEGGSGSVLRGVALVQRMLEPRGDGRPRSWYVPELERFPERMRDYVWEQPDARDAGVQQPVKRDDDLMDADRYMHEQADLADPALRRGRKSAARRLREVPIEFPRRGPQPARRGAAAEYGSYT